jgi:23S rRNA pseudouridine1911/1915/1917 synthase
VTGPVFAEVVPAALDGERVDRLVALLAGCSRADAAALVASGAVLLDGQVTAGKAKAREGQELVLLQGPPSHDVRAVADPSVDVPILHADADVVVVDKPEGLVVHPGAGHDTGTLVNGLLARFPDLADVGDPARPGVVHRLDRGTSGLLVVARTARAYDDLVAQLAARTIERRYLAVAWGVPEAASGLVDAPIGRSAREPTRMAVAADGREARTRYEVRSAFSDPVAAALLECRLETGRTHQIRVHLAAIGHPVVGDGTYGGQRPGLAARRPMLHAWRLAFRHPATGEEVAFTAAPPPDFTALLDQLH